MTRSKTLRRARKRAGVSQKQLGVTLRLSQPSISTMETGVRRLDDDEFTRLLRVIEMLDRAEKAAKAAAKEARQRTFREARGSLGRRKPHFRNPKIKEVLEG